MIVGLGLIGGSYAKKLSLNGYHVGAISLQQDDINYAIDNGIIKEGTTKVEKDFVSKFDVVVLALYPNVLLNWIEEYHSYLKPYCIVTDVTGVKSAIVDKVQTLLGSNAEFVGAHPMAGKEVYGVKNASESLFVGANFIITPTDVNTLEGIEVVCKLAKELEVGTVSIITPKKHDEMIAFLSQLTHCIAVALMTCKDAQDLKDYTGDSFRDLTRIANINENMWSELFMLNKEDLLDQMDLFIEEFQKLKKSLLDNDIETMKDMMRLSTHRRSFFDKK